MLRIQDGFKTLERLGGTDSNPFPHIQILIALLTDFVLVSRIFGLFFFKMKTLFKLRGLTAPIAPTPSLCLTTITICSKILWVALIN